MLSQLSRPIINSMEHARLHAMSSRVKLKDTKRSYLRDHAFLIVLVAEQLHSKFHFKTVY